MRISLVSALAVGAAIAVTGCAEVGKYSVRVEAPDVQRAKERIRTSHEAELVLDTDAGRALSSKTTRVIVAYPVGGEPPPRAARPTSLQSALVRAQGPMNLVLVERKPLKREPDRGLMRAGGYTAMAGGAVGLVGLFVAAGAVLIAGPANDTRRVGVGGGITMAVGAGVAIVGGTIALVGYAPAIEPGVPLAADDLGRGRVR